VVLRARSYIRRRYLREHMITKRKKSDATLEEAKLIEIGILGRFMLLQTEVEHSARLTVEGSYSVLYKVTISF